MKSKILKNIKKHAFEPVVENVLETQKILNLIPARVNYYPLFKEGLMFEGQILRFALNPKKTCRVTSSSISPSLNPQTKQKEAFNLILLDLSNKTLINGEAFIKKGLKDFPDHSQNKSPPSILLCDENEVSLYRL